MPACLSPSLATGAAPVYGLQLEPDARQQIVGLAAGDRVVAFAGDDYHHWLSRGARDTVDGLRPIRRAISRTPIPCAESSAISSRSAKDKYLPDTGVDSKRLGKAC